MESLRRGSDTRAYSCMKRLGLPECSKLRWKKLGFADEYECSDRVISEATKRCGHLCE
jgi:hypothetical protein